MKSSNIKQVWGEGLWLKQEIYGMKYHLSPNSSSSIYKKPKLMLVIKLESCYLFLIAVDYTKVIFQKIQRKWKTFTGTNKKKYYPIKSIKMTKILSCTTISGKEKEREREKKKPFPNEKSVVNVLKYWPLQKFLSENILLLSVSKLYDNL